MGVAVIARRPSGRFAMTALGPAGEWSMVVCFASDLSHDRCRPRVQGVRKLNINTQVPGTFKFTGALAPLLGPGKAPEHRISLESTERNFLVLSGVVGSMKLLTI